MFAEPTVKNPPRNNRHLQFLKSLLVDLFEFRGTDYCLEPLGEKTKSESKTKVGILFLVHSVTMQPETLEEMLQSREYSGFQTTVTMSRKAFFNLWRHRDVS